MARFFEGLDGTFQRLGARALSEPRQGLLDGTLQVSRGLHHALHERLRRATPGDIAVDPRRIQPKATRVLLAYDLRIRVEIHAALSHTLSVVIYRSGTHVDDHCLSG